MTEKGGEMKGERGEGERERDGQTDRQTDRQRVRAELWNTDSWEERKKGGVGWIRPWKRKNVSSCKHFCHKTLTPARTLRLL